MTRRHALRLIPLAILPAVLLYGCAGGGKPESGPADEPKPADRPVLLYCTHFTAEGEQQYAPDGPFAEVLGRLGEDFDVRVTDKRPTRGRLAGADVLLIVNPSDDAVDGGPLPHHVERADVHAIVNWVQGGGGLVFLSNQTEGHNVEKRAANELLREFGLGVTEYTIGVKRVAIPSGAPIVGGLRWAYYYGSPLAVDAGHFARPRAIVRNDPEVPAQQGKGVAGPDAPLLAIAEVGRGRVVVAGDTGWIADWALLEREPYGTIRGQDNWEMFRRLARWAAGLRAEAQRPDRAQTAK